MLHASKPQLRPEISQMGIDDQGIVECDFITLRESDPTWVIDP